MSISVQTRSFCWCIGRAASIRGCVSTSVAGASDARRRRWRSSKQSVCWLECATTIRLLGGSVVRVFLLRAAIRGHALWSPVCATAIAYRAIHGNGSRLKVG